MYREENSQLIEILVTIFVSLAVLWIFSEIAIKRQENRDN